MIDVQERLVPAMADFDRVLDNLRRLLRGFAVLELPIVATEQYPAGLGPTIAPIAELLPTPPPAKVAFSCYGCEPFTEAVAPFQDLVIAGLETHVCVLQTALDTLARGQRAFVVADAVASRDPRNRDIALAQLAFAGAVVTSTETILFQLLGAAGSDAFRAISKLVR